MDYNIDAILALEDGDIRVDIQDLKELNNAFETGDKEFVHIFLKKYVQLTAIRNEEKRAYNNFDMAKKLARNESDQPFVNQLRNEYSEIRLDRIGLQKEIKAYEDTHYRLDRVMERIFEQEKSSNAPTKPRIMGTSR